MDTSVLVVGGVAIAALLIALIAAIRLRRLSRSVDHALTRIGGAPAGHWWRRIPALRQAITELEESTGAAQRSRARLAGAVAQAPIGILLTDDDGAVLNANEAASRYLGVRHGEVVADSGTRQAIESAILGRRPVHREVELHSPKHRHLEIGALPLEHGVESVGSVAYVKDVTEARRVEAMRSDFIANVGHELRSPLAELAALTGTLADQLGDPEVAASLADQLRARADRLSELVEGVLDLSQAEAPGRARGPIPLDAVLADVAAELGPVATEKGVHLDVQTFPSGAVVLGDRRQLQTMFSHLIENAIRYSHPDRTERRPLVSAGATITGDALVITVEDEGIGIAESHLPRIFERFYKVDRTDGGTEGTGLGLSVARHIARNHGGEITVESRLGIGTTFRVRLPICKQG